MGAGGGPWQAGSEFSGVFRARSVYINRMEEIIESISSRLGIPAASTRNAVKVILQFARDQMNPADFEQLVSRIPNAAGLIAELGPQTATETQGGGLMGGLSALLGGPAAQILAKLQATGVPSSQLVPLVQAFLDKAREEGAGDAVDALLAKLPALRAFVK